MLSIINCLLADGRISKCFWSDLWLSRALLWRLNLGFDKFKRSQRTNLPQKLLYKFVPSILKFSLRNAMVHFSRSNDVRMGPFRWLPVLGSCPKNCSLSKIFGRFWSNLCCSYFWEKHASGFRVMILTGHLKLKAALNPIMVYLHPNHCCRRI